MLPAAARRVLQGRLCRPCSVHSASSTFENGHSIGKSLRCFGPSQTVLGRTASSQPKGDDALEAEESILTLPDDVRTLGALNPELAKVMVEAQAYERSRSWVDLAASASRAMAEELSVPPHQRPTKSALSRLKASSLRTLAREAGLPEVGLKRDVLERLTDALKEEASARSVFMGRGVAARASEARGSEALASATPPSPSTSAYSLGDLHLRRHVPATARPHSGAGRPEWREGGAKERSAARARLGSVARPPIAAQRQSWRIRQSLAAGGELASVSAPGRAPGEHPLAGVHVTPEEVADILGDWYARDVVVLDVRHRCSYASWMVLATAQSSRALWAAACAVQEDLKQRAARAAAGRGEEAVHGGAVDASNPLLPSSPFNALEGDAHSDWVVVDAQDVVVHVFLEHARAQYALEEVWTDADGGNLVRVPLKKQAQTLDTMQ